MSSELKSKIIDQLRDVCKYIKVDGIRDIMGSYFVPVREFVVEYYCYPSSQLCVKKNNIDITEDANEEEKEQIYEKISNYLNEMYLSLIEKEKQVRKQTMLDFIEGK